VTPADRAFELISGFRASQLVHAAAELKISDLLAHGPLTADELSSATQIHRGRLHRFLRGLVVLGVLKESEDGRFANTEVGELFREGVQGSRRPSAMMMIPHDYLSWAHFMDTLRSGETGQQLAYGETLWDSMAHDPDFAVRFNQAMVANSELAVELVSSLGEFADAALVVDVGGGKGGLVGGILARHHHLRGIVCDLPAGLAEAQAYLAGIGVADRCAISECDFFRSVPPGGDLYLLKDILHDWDDDHAAIILSVCRQAMHPGARLMVVERVLPSRVSDDPKHMQPVMTDLHMMVLLGGRERTLEDYRALFVGAGFSFTRHVGGQPFSIVEAVAV
jgi:orsellinic acid C2-O-methyltransferase